MLGVLAIIGILSVGAISGYSKAMTKYKLNKQTEQINSLINNSYQLWNSDKSINMSTNLTPILIKLNIVPSEMIKEGKTNVIIDALKNDLYIAWEATSSPSPYNGFFQLTILGRGENYKIDDETCLNILNLSKEISPILWQTHFVYSAEDEDSTNYGVRTFGDSYCTKSTSCLKDLTISKIRELCNTCYEQKKCYMRILWL